MTDQDNETLKGTALVRAILKNSHESLKWLWLIIMGESIVKAIEKYSSLLHPENVNNLFSLVNMFLTTNSLVLISFVFVFIRFYFGDSRFLDLSYEETLFRKGLESEIKKYSGRKMFFDILLLLTHGIIFYLMALVIADPLHYIIFFIVLLMANTVWLLAQIMVRVTNSRSYDEPLIGNLNTVFPMLVWIINNLIFQVIMSYMIFSSYSDKAIYALLASLLNSGFDFYFTWRFYFPPLNEFVENE